MRREALQEHLTALPLRIGALTQYCSLNDFNHLPEVDSWQGLGMPGTKWKIAHLALDASQVAPIAARHDPLLENLFEHSVMKRFPPLRGE